MIGQLVGNYRINKVLGQGAFGVVYLADEEFQGQVVRPVALKLIESKDAAQSTAIINELKALANVPHPHIVSYYQALPVEGRPFVMLALEFADGGTLTDNWQAREMSPRELLELARDVADGLDFIARRGMVHRDIKPDNILRYSRGHETIWKISDLGLARPTIVDGRATGKAGTPLYMAPETWSGLPSPASDMWALGLCLHEAATRRRLWDDAALGALEYLVCEEEVPLDTDLPLVLRPLIEGCLQKDPAHRWSAAHARQWVRKTLEHLPSPPSPNFVVSQSGGGTHATIRDALAEAPSGSTIAIHPGRYTENLIIEKTLFLLGCDPKGGQARDKVIIECGSSNVLKITSGTVRLENLTFRGAAGAVGKRFYTVSVTKAQVGLKNCALSSDSLACLLAGGGSKIGLIDCHVTESAADGILVQEGSTLMINGCRLENCARSGLLGKKDVDIKAIASKIVGCGETGIKLNEESALTLENCTLSRNGCGLHLGSSARATISGGQIARNHRQGVRVERGVVMVIEGCDLSGNGFGSWEVAAGASVTRKNNIAG